MNGDLLWFYILEGFILVDCLKYNYNNCDKNKMKVKMILEGEVK